MGYYFWYCYNTDISKVIQFKMSLFWNAKKSSAIKTKFKICLGWHKKEEKDIFLEIWNEKKIVDSYIEEERGRFSFAKTSLYSKARTHLIVKVNFRSNDWCVFKGCYTILTLLYLIRLFSVVDTIRQLLQSN